MSVFRRATPQHADADQAGLGLGPALRSSSDPTTRSAAALALRDAGTSEARDDLRSALADEPDELVIADIAASLALVGDAEDVPAIMAAAARVSGPTGGRVRFAAALVASRSGVDGPTPEFPGAGPALSGDAVTVSSAPASEDEQRAALEGLSRDAPGLLANPIAVSRIDCGRRVLLVAIAGEVGLTPGVVLSRRMVLGAALDVSSTTGLTSTAMLVLSHPTDDGCELFISRTHGEPLYRGAGTLSPSGLNGTIEAVAAPGVAPGRLSFDLTGSTLSVNGLSQAVIRTKRQPALATSTTTEVEHG